MNTATEIASLDYSEDINMEAYDIPYNIPVGLNLDDSKSLSSTSNTSQTINNIKGDVPHLHIAPNTMVHLKGKFKLLQLWEGRIIEVRDEDFDAIIKDKTKPDFSDELVTIDKIDISPDDYDLLKRGSVFYWSVGFLDYPGRGRSRESKIRFRRLKGWSEKEIRNAKITGKEFAEFFESNLP